VCYDTVLFIICEQKQDVYTKLWFKGIITHVLTGRLRRKMEKEEGLITEGCSDKVGK
jgi:hypothetical protein